MTSVSPVEQFFLGEVAEVRRGLATFWSDQPRLTVLTIVALLTDLPAEDATKILRDLARTLRPPLPVRGPGIHDRSEAIQ
jgi:hypothetical protein